MSDITILGQVALGYSPFIDRQRAVTATRLTVFPLRPDAVLDVGQLLHEVGNVWPASGARVSLNLVSESLLQELLLAQPTANLMVEVPAFMAADEANVDALVALHKNGSTLLLKGRPLKELPRAVLPCFKYSIIDLADDRRVNDPHAPTGVTRSIAHVQSGVRTVADMEGAFARGAEAVLGWPIDDAVTTTAARSGQAVAAPGMQTIAELIRQVDKEEPIEKLETTLKRDPALAFKLLRYINSPAFGLRVEISSFRHAIMMLGYQRLKRWLALLLATASKDVNLKPVMFAAVRRGLLMEELVRGSGDEEMRNEMFICGVFSLLDRMFQQPFSKLLESIPVPERVRQALADGDGPYQPYVELVQAIENEALFDFREAADRLMMSVSEINRAELRALMSASELE
ncbi:EAL and HDOD domain-containing protein [Rhizobacter sp. Root404]|jgi:EAL and modified HD-GYP domain-containing signal transduction protein|uniref:EAL and HDOD domain-containing protein n=1 Tax=Rhizobacter sp. Root404 TaxID=1736528 RepID=UPI0006F74FEC|nr:HDOD domain-containing protein [Rhizobacter sp. Root404]KQW40588.1 histidine kinase [Rhizobacter sp. Root404]